MDVATVDNSYAQLQQQSQQTAQLIQALAGKLQAAAGTGDTNAREWLLDLKEITLGVQTEESQAGLLLQAIHSLVDNHVQQVTTAPQFQQAPVQYQQAYAPGGGGMLQRFLGGGFGRAVATGAGFGIGDSLIQDIFN